MNSLIKNMYKKTLFPQYSQQKAVFRKLVKTKPHEPGFYTTFSECYPCTLFKSFQHVAIKQITACLLLEYVLKKNKPKQKIATQFLKPLLLTTLVNNPAGSIKPSDVEKLRQFLELPDNEAVRDVIQEYLRTELINLLNLISESPEPKIIKVSLANWQILLTLIVIIVVAGLFFFFIRKHYTFRIRKNYILFRKKKNTHEKMKQEKNRY